jgi:hypothetical protein
MAFRLLGGGSDLSTVVNDVNANILELKNQEVTKIFKDETGIRRVILDKDGLRTSPAGVDVVTAGNNTLSFNSNQNTLKVVLSGTVALLPTVGSNAYAVVEHNLGYIPAALVYLTDATGVVYAALPSFDNINTSGSTLEFGSYFTYTVTESELMLTAASSTAVVAATRYFKYFMLQESVQI